MFSFNENWDIAGDPRVPAHVRREHENRYEIILPQVQGKTALDIGCGYGYGSAMIAHAAETVTGVDVNAESIVVATERYQNVSNLSFVIDDAIAFLRSTPTMFDVAVLFEVIEHVEDQDQLLQSVWEAMAEGGRLFLSTPDKRKTPFYRKNPYHLRELSSTELVEMVGRSFTIDFFRGQIQKPWAFLPPSFLAPVTSRLRIYERIVRLNDRPENSMTMIISGVKRSEVAPAS